MNPDFSFQVSEYTQSRMEQLDAVLAHIKPVFLAHPIEPSPYADLTDRLLELYPNTVLVRFRMVLSGEDLPLEERRYLELPRLRQIEAFYLVDPETLIEPAHGYVEIGLLKPPHVRAVYQFTERNYDHQRARGGERYLAQYPVDPHPEMAEFDLVLTELLLGADPADYASYPQNDDLDGDLAGLEWVDVLALPAEAYVHAAKPTPSPSRPHPPT